MKLKLKMLFLTAVLGLGVSTTAQAAVVCTTGSLASYATLGAAGCTFGGGTFSNFGLTPNANPNSINVPAASITVTPIADANGFGFLFSSGWAVNSPDLFIDSLISYTASGTQFTKEYLSFNGQASGTGLAGVSEQVCAVSCGTMGVSTAAGTFTNTLNVNGTTLQLSKDIVVSAGSHGSAFISDVRNQFNAVPEPATFGYMAAGLLALGFAKRKSLVS